MALNGFLQCLGLQKDLGTRPKEGMGEGGGQVRGYGWWWLWCLVVARRTAQMLGEFKG